jgi:hypothetical protein
MLAKATNVFWLLSFYFSADELASKFNLMHVDRAHHQRVAGKILTHTKNYGGFLKTKKIIFQYTNGEIFFLH